MNTHGATEVWVSLVTGDINNRIGRGQQVAEGDRNNRIVEQYRARTILAYNAEDDQIARPGSALLMPYRRDLGQ